MSDNKSKYFDSKYIGSTVGTYRVVEIVESIYNKSRPMWIIECICGRRAEIQPSWFLNGRVHKCICRKSTKDMERTESEDYKLTKSDKEKIRKVRRLMISRCYNINNASYKIYGNRGITVQNTWIESLKTFINWSQENGYRPWYRLMRQNLDCGYTEDNCYWGLIQEEKENISKLYDKEELVTLGINISLLDREVKSGRIGEDEVIRIVEILKRKKKKDNSTSIRLRKGLEINIGNSIKTVYNTELLMKALNLKDDTRKSFKAQQYIEEAKVLMQLALEEIKGAD